MELHAVACSPGVQEVVQRAADEPSAFPPLHVYMYLRQQQQAVPSLFYQVC